MAAKTKDPAAADQDVHQAPRDLAFGEFDDVRNLAAELRKVQAQLGDVERAHRAACGELSAPERMRLPTPDPMAAAAGDRHSEIFTDPETGHLRILRDDGARGHRVALYPSAPLQLKLQLAGRVKALAGRLRRLAVVFAERRSAAVLWLVTTPADGLPEARPAALASAALAAFIVHLAGQAPAGVELAFVRAELAGERRLSPDDCAEAFDELAEVEALYGPALYFLAPSASR